MILAGAPRALRGDKSFFSNEEPAIAALKLFVVNLMIAGFPE
jgi:hypothetical protein